MTVLKIPSEVKLKHLPLETRVALRLVTLAEMRKNVAEIRPMAKELGAQFMEVMMAVVSLEKQAVIKVVPVTANSFEFEVEPENRKVLQLAASSYNRHLKSKSGKTKSFAGLPPAHLVPITGEQRQLWMGKAAVIATKIGVPKLDFKVANCIVRIGEEEVNKILESVLSKCKEMVEKNQEDAPSCVRMFFTLYAARRDELLKPDVELWLVESPSNNYQPSPPPGWFGMRSHKRRGFFKLDDGKMPGGDEINRRLKADEFKEMPLISDLPDVS